MKDRVYWLINSEQDVKYDKTTWYRCVGIENFIKRTEEKFEIVGVLAEENNLGFVLKDKTGEKNE